MAKEEIALSQCFQMSSAAADNKNEYLWSKGLNQMLPGKITCPFSVLIQHFFIDSLFISMLEWK